MPLVFASAGIVVGGTNSAAFICLASLAATAVGASGDAVSPPPPPQDINKAASGSQNAQRPARASPSMARPPSWSAGSLL